MLEMHNAQAIDGLIQAEQAKAEAYAAQPERFTLFSLELDIRTEDGNHLVLYNDGQWSCSCDFFKEWQTCSHTRATAFLLKDSLLPQPVGENNEVGPESLVVSS